MKRSFEVTGDDFCDSYFDIEGGRTTECLNRSHVLAWAAVPGSGTELPHAPPPVGMNHEWEAEVLRDFAAAPLVQIPQLFREVMRLESPQTLTVVVSRRREAHAAPREQGLKPLLVLLQAELQQGSDSLEPASLLVALIRDPTTRTAALRIALELIPAARATDAVAVVREEVMRLLQSDDASLFLCAASLLSDAEVRPEHLARCARILADSSRSRETVRRLLTRWPTDGRGLLLLRNQITVERSARFRFALAESLVQVATEAELSDAVKVALADESPSLRVRAVGFLRLFSDGLAAHLALEALADEPDPVIQEMLRRASMRLAANQ